MSLVRVQVLYSGRVQGVGFRYTVKSLVAGYDVLGVIRNLPDGRVELIVEGKQEELWILAEREGVDDSFIGARLGRCISYAQS